VYIKVFKESIMFIKKQNALKHNYVNYLVLSYDKVLLTFIIKCNKCIMIWFVYKYDTVKYKIIK